MAWLRLVVPAALLLPTAALLGACDRQIEEPDDGDAEHSEVGTPGDDQDAEDPTDGADGDDENPSGSTGPSQPAAPKPDAAVPCDLNAWGGYACTTDDGQEGTNFCIVVDGEELYTPCSTEAPACEPGEGLDMGCLGEICYWDGDAFQRFSWSEPDCNTPLVVNFEDAPVSFSPAAAAAFDLSTDGTCMSTDWPTAPWLALDRDGDGFIRSGAELFGNATRMSSGGHAEHGFAALAELDSNRDGKISAEDDRFSELVLWSDLDDDRVGAYGELRPLADMALVSIDLGFGRRRDCDAQGNCGYERAAFEYRTAQGGLRVGEVVDVHVACR